MDFIPDIFFWNADGAGPVGTFSRLDVLDHLEIMKGPSPARLGSERKIPTHRQQRALEGGF